MEDFSNLTKEDILSKMEELDEKYRKLVNLAMKIGGEMDVLSENYHHLENLLASTES